MHRTKRNDGFTLLEMLVALAVFAVIGIMSSQLLTQMVDVTDRATSRGEQLIELQRAFVIMRRDFEQLAFRAVRDELGDPGYDVSVGTGFLVEFTRRGWANPTFRPRSQLQRVAYELRPDGLYRLFWPILDRAPTTEPVVQLLLADVQSAEFSAIDLSAEEHSFWPLLTEDAGEPERALVAIKADISGDAIGEITRIWTTPQVAVSPDASDDADESESDDGSGLDEDDETGDGSRRRARPSPRSDR